MYDDSFDAAGFTVTEEDYLTTACPSCAQVARLVLPGNCGNCGVLLIPTGGMPDTPPQTNAYKQDGDGSWRLVFVPGGGPR
jgi:hypothetical protein